MPGYPKEKRNRKRDNDLRRRKLRDPKYRAQHNAKHREQYAKRMNDPKKRAKYRKKRLIWNRLYWYGCTHEQFEVLLAKQNGVCAICFQPETSKRNGVVRPLAVDHDHDTGAIRGLLCQRCNLSIGLMRDNPHLCYAAGDYFNEHKS